VEGIARPEVERRDHVTSRSGACADDVDVTDDIETCHGVRPVLLSDRFVDRRPSISGMQLNFLLYSLFHLKQRSTSHSMNSFCLMTDLFLHTLFSSRPGHQLVKHEECIELRLHSRNSVFYTNSVSE